jgi:voltage-gated potassium channel
MPVLGLIAIGRFFLHIAAALWRKQEVRGLLLIVFITILSGTWFYHQFEPTITTWVDAYYFTVITLTTIGYGDFSPTTPLTKIFTTLYVFIGLGIIAGLIGLVGETMIEDANRTRAKRNTRTEDVES